MLTLQIMDDRLMKALAKLDPALGVTVRDIANDQMRLWLLSLVKLTPPSKALFGGGMPSGLKGKGDIAIGKRAVSGDLMDLFHGVMASTKSKDIGDGMVKITTSDDAVWTTRVVNWSRDASESELERYHKSKRNRRNHVVRLGVRKSRNVTGLTDVNRKHVKRVVLNRYIKNVQKRVGTLKAGWIPALTHYANLAKKPFTPPAWARKLQLRGTHGGRISDRGTGMIESTNTIPYMSEKMRDSAIAATQRIRELDMQKHLTTRVNQVAKRFSENQPMKAAA